jgi:hypothetical protein
MSVCGGASVFGLLLDFLSACVWDIRVSADRQHGSMQANVDVNVHSEP